MHRANPWSVQSQGSHECAVSQLRLCTEQSEWLKALFVLTGFEATAFPPVSLGTICTTLPVFQELAGLFPHPELLLPWETLSCTLHFHGMEILPP